MSRTLPARDTRWSAAALTALTVVTGLAMARLFAGSRVVVPIIVVALAAHGVSWWAREREVPAALAAAAAGGASLLAVAWVALPHTTAYGFPFRGTVSVFVRELQHAATDFSTAVAPTKTTLGFLLASMVGVALVALLGDWAAFRAGSTFEGAVPALGLFAFGSLLGDGRNRWMWVGVWVAAAAAFLTIHHAEHQAGRTPWFASRTSGGITALLRGAAVLGGISVLAAVLLGPHVPGANAEPVFKWRNNNGENAGRRTTISPLVDIRGRLVDRSTTEVFTVKANDRAYWRLTSLDTFDGVIWSSNDPYERVKTKLPTGPGGTPPGTTITQEYQILDLASIWLPAAYRPLEVSGVSGVSFNPSSASLISREATSDGLSYTVVSQRPGLSPEALSGAPPATPATVAKSLELPPIAPRVVSLARELTAGATTPFAKARAIQDFLRTRFTYDLGVDQGHGNEALENFLFTTRRGYCEQFAGSFAVLARLALLPTRVAVGFTPGVLGADGRYHVQGLHAHAWPEVYFAGFGWVAFEPTPGRGGAPGSEAYTGANESQADATQPQAATSVVPTTQEPTPEGTGSTTTTTAAPTTTTAAPEIPSKPPWWRWPLLALVLLVALVGGWAGAAPAIINARRRARRRNARTAAQRILVSWTEADESLAYADARRYRGETLAEHASRAGRQLPGAAGADLRGLAQAVAVASYAVEVPEELVGEAERQAGAVEVAARAKVPGWKRQIRTMLLR